jgi:hypothetical protein
VNALGHLLILLMMEEAARSFPFSSITCNLEVGSLIQFDLNHSSRELHIIHVQCVWDYLLAPYRLFNYTYTIS